ncbi:hypothetical protein UFOVP685_10 [uncultured Caudovirales phage]|uniref:Uncharacterized protein n=1 Tax=uncultured Caudovirales phage TaxID=2100421 RepID=A0A6J7X9H4_9CAUD|nr:hypothetical protein UFOVP590_13 [uncultured Caudovirales phage]CAB4157224.1 hypothetical protein UFOVP685_10 [uncultured Caudovirales phage]CAB5225524.1 hypothetical protein UFOVP750_42 [uncultured Caudovirales phage]
MSTRIPLPGNMIDTLMNGVKTGSSLYSGIMHPILEREKQKQAEAHFQEQLKLHKAAAGRAAQAAADAHKKMDPMYEINQFKALQDFITGGGQIEGQPGGAMPGAQQPQPTQEMGQGMGMFSPEGMQQAQQPQQAPQASPQGAPGMNFDMLRQNPMLRGFFKHKFGYDPLAAAAQTPEDKQAASLNLFKQKEDIKKQSKGGDIPTNTVLTQNQQALQGIKTVLPMLDELINNPKSVYGPTDFSPSKKAAYNAKTSGMIDTLVAAQSLPKVQASIDLVEQQIRRGTNESTANYINRLKELRKDLVNRKGRAKDVLSNRKVNTSDDDDFSQMSDDELRKIAGGG